MNNGTTALIPLAPQDADLATYHGEFQMRLFSQRRAAALAEVRMLSGIPALARDLAPNKLYRLVLPEGTVLQKTKDGLYGGVVYGPDGKIAKHAKFEKVSPSLSRVAATVGSQVLLISIAMQLNRLESAVAALSEELHYDRIAEILAGIQQYETATHMTDPVQRDGCIWNAIQSLTEGLAKVRFELRERIHSMPESTNTFWDNWGGSKTSRATKQLSLAQESFHAALTGASTLSECYAALNEPKAGAISICRCLEDIQACDIHIAAERARIAGVTDKNSLPEAPWLAFDAARKDFVEKVSRTPLEATIIQEEGQVAIDFRPYELLEEA